MTEKVSAQGILDALLLDSETIEHIKQLVKAVDPEKIKQILEMIEVDQDGWINIKINLGIKK